MTMEQMIEIIERHIQAFNTMNFHKVQELDLQNKLVLNSPGDLVDLAEDPAAEKWIEWYTAARREVAVKILDKLFGEIEKKGN